MELRAVIEALKALKRRCTVVVHTDSQYGQKGMCEWIVNWKRRGWRTADKKPVKNADLWQELDALVAQHDLSWQWVRGHAGDPRSEEHTSELQSLMRISYAVFCLKKKKNRIHE